MVPGFSKQHLCNRDFTKIRIPRILGRDPHDSRLPNPYLAEVRGKQRASQPVQDSRKTAPPRGAGYALCWTTIGSARAPHDGATGLLGSAMRSAAPVRSRPGPRKTAPHRGAGHGFVPVEPRGNTSRPAQGPCRAPPGGAMRSALPAMRQAAGAPSAWSQPSQSTHERPRRWCDAGSPGRQCVQAAQKAGAEGRFRDNGSDRDRGCFRIRGR